MSNMVLLGTRKDTVILDRMNGAWHPRPIEHAGIPACYGVRDRREGTLWASIVVSLLIRPYEVLNSVRLELVERRVFFDKFSTNGSNIKGPD